MKLLKNNRGQGLVEYMIIVALMAIATMGVMRILSKTASGKLAQITQSLQGGKAGLNIQFEKVQQNHIKKKDMSDFIQGSRNSRDR
jgi:pilus assembly protein Flp/PilA